MKTNRDAFERMRYIHEDDGAGSGFMMTDLPQMLRQVAVEIMPQWQFAIHAQPIEMPGFSPITTAADANP